MTTEGYFIEVSGIRVEVVRKAIKHLYVRVYPPEGRVRVAAPLGLDDETIRQVVISRLGWIRRQRDRFARGLRQLRREMVSGEGHYFLGRRYRLEVVEGNGPGRVEQRGDARLVLHVRPGADRERRARVLDEWYRAELRKLIPEAIRKWEPVIGVEVAEWGIKRMKTRWGSCNVRAHRIWLNLELARRPPQCLEYVLVHEMVHLIERRHNERFYRLMDRFLPQWRHHRDLLNE